jgi:hypothetical protein
MSFGRWNDDPLEFLVRCRFPLEKVYAAAIPTLGNLSKFSRNEAYLKEAADYRAELKQLPRTELLERAKEAAKTEADKALAKAAAEEAGRFFNQPSASADLQHWTRMSLWTLDEAVALSLGKDPRRVNWDNVRSLVQISAFAAEFQSRREIILRAKQAGQLWEQTIPGVFVAWAERMRVELPLPLTEGIRSLGVQVADWKSAYDVQKRLADEARAELAAEREATIQRASEHVADIEKMGSGYRELIDRHEAKIKALEQAAQQAISIASMTQNGAAAATDKPLGVRERESLLKLVIGMAVAGYGYDPKASRSDRVSEIASDLEKAGVALDVDTVRKYLREARELMPPAETEQKG